MIGLKIELAGEAVQSAVGDGRRKKKFHHIVWQIFFS
jgi:hypothetical protein